MTSLSQKAQHKLKEALMLCQQGRLKEGKLYLGELYNEFPHCPDILTPLGTIAIQEGHLEEGIQKLETSLKMNSKQPLALNNIGNAYLEIKKNEEAIQAFQKAIEISPAFIDAYYNKGRAYLALSEYDKALSLFDHVLQKEPQYLWAYISQGYCYYELEKYHEALASYDEALKLYSPMAELHFNRGLVQTELKLFKEAIQSFNYVIELNPNYKDVYISLGNVLVDCREWAQAMESYRHGLKLDPQNLDIYAHIMFLYDHLNDDKPDQSLIDDALKIDPNFEPALFAKASLLTRQGHFEEGVPILNLLISKKSKYTAHCYRKLSEGKRFTDPADNLIKQMKDLLQNSAQDKKSQATISYALGKIYEDLKLYDEAYKYYAEGNRLSLKDDYDINESILGLDSIAQQVDDDFIKKLSKLGSDDTIPIIIVGMPRSGTTLTEQIISSHPYVKPAGEVAFWNVPNKFDAVKNISKEAWQDIVKKYESLIKKESHADKSTLRVTDKMPHNFRILGIIAALFPKAKLIHCRRHPMDNCWSIFSLPFNEFHGYGQNLEFLGKYYVAYHKLMKHWESLFPGRIMTIDYEKTVQDPEYWSRQLIEHVGLPWDDACLSPHKNIRSVKTFSQWQVRQPIYKTSVRRSDHFAKYLQPLKAILENAHIDLS